MRSILAALAAVACAVAIGCSRNQAEESPAAADSTAADSTRQAGSGRGKGKKDKDAKEPAAEQAVPVDVTVLQRGAIESVIRATATLEAENQVGVVAEAARRVTELRVEEGHRVQRGHVLLRLQDAEQRTALKRAEFNMAKAVREFDRQKNLRERDLTSEEAYIAAEEEHSRSKLALEDAERELSYTEVRAPISGVVTQRHVNLGDQVQVGQRLFDLVDFESLVARVYVPEKNLSEVRTGQEARLHAAAVGAQAFTGKVDRIAPIVDPKSGTVKVTVGVAHQTGLRPGLFVDVELITATLADALLMPKRALIYDNDQIFVYRLKPGRRVERLLVPPLMADRDHVVPATGFAPGDTVVVAGQAGLKDGALVRLPGDPEQ
jgi:membrane fusion protein (multidrug efflux system)